MKACFMTAILLPLALAACSGDKGDAGAAENPAKSSAQSSVEGTTTAEATAVESAPTTTVKPDDAAPDFGSGQYRTAESDAIADAIFGDLDKPDPKADALAEEICRDLKQENKSGGEATSNEAQ